MHEQTRYIDLRTRERETAFFFMLNAFLKARIDTDNESDADEEVNVYMAHLLHSVVDGRFYADHAGDLASSPLDVQARVEARDSDRHKLRVYRSNADHRLVAFGLFAGTGEHRSFYRRNLGGSPEEPLEEAQQYYGWAALFGKRMPSRYAGLAQALEKLSARFGTYREVFGRMGAEYMGLIRRLSPGQVFHLEREAHRAALPGIGAEVLDALLNAYVAWQSEPTAARRRRFQALCEQYEAMKSEAKAAGPSN